MNKNIICFFSFPFITQNVQIGWVQENQRRPRVAHTGAETRIFREPLLYSSLFGSQSSWLYNILNAHANSRGYTSSQPPAHCIQIRLILVWHPRKFSWTYFLQEYRLHNACGHATFYRAAQRNLRGISTENTCALITLITRCISG